MFSLFISIKNINKCAIFVVAFFASTMCLAGTDVKDDRHSSSTCSADKAFVLTCDYRYSARLDVKDVLLEVDGKEVQVKADDHKVFPATKEQTAAVLILADVSDPKRKNTEVAPLI